MGGGRLDPEARGYVAESFRRFDDGGKGWLSRFEAKLALASLLGYKPSKREVELVSSRSPEGRVDLRALEAYTVERLCREDPGDVTRLVFKAFDARCAGFISRADLHHAFTNCAPSVARRTIDEIFDEVDVDGDGRVSCKEFESMMRAGAAIR